MSIFFLTEIPASKKNAAITFKLQRSKLQKASCILLDGTASYAHMLFFFPAKCLNNELGFRFCELEPSNSILLYLLGNELAQGN